MKAISVCAMFAILSLWMPLGTLHASSGALFALSKLTDGVYVHYGQHAGLDHDAREDSANLGVVVGQRCIAVIDTGGSVKTGAAFRKVIEAQFMLPVCFVINTHVHFDHVLGNAAFQQPGVTFTGHQALAEEMAGNRDFFAESFAAELGGPGQQALVIGPERMIEAETELDLGGRRLRLRAHEPAHSSTDLTVEDLKTRVLFAGDLLFRERLPVLDGSLIAWLEWMESTMAKPFSIVIPGHGPADSDWPEGAYPQYQYLSALLTETRQAIADGLFLDDAGTVVAKSELSGWQLTERAHRVNVSRAYRALEWE